MVTDIPSNKQTSSTWNYNETSSLFFAFHYFLQYKKLGDYGRPGQYGYRVCLNMDVKSKMKNDKF